MSSRNSAFRALHDLGAAAWFGGALMGAVGVNGASAVVDNPKERIRVASAGWGRWTPVTMTGATVAPQRADRPMRSWSR
jgi:hypothetical protein